MLNRSIALLLAVGLSILLQSCIPIVDSSEELLSDEKRAQLQVGSTTKEETYATFGQPEFMTEDGVSILYTETRRKWILLFPGQLEPGAGNVQKNLYLEFDDQNVLSHFELVKFVDRKACAKTGICMLRPGYAMSEFFVIFTRPTYEDREAKRFNPLPEHCSIYLYGSVSIDKNYSVSAWHQVCLDGQQDSATLYSPDLYLNWHLPPGSHRITVQNAWAWNWRTGSAANFYLGFTNRSDDDWETLSRPVDCKAGEIYFFRIKENVEPKKAEKEDRADWIFSTKYVSTEFSLERVSAEIGQAMITDKSLFADLATVNLDPDADTISIGQLVSNCIFFTD